MVVRSGKAEQTRLSQSTLVRRSIRKIQVPCFWVCFLPDVVYQLYVRGGGALRRPTSLFADAGWLLPQNWRIAAAFSVLDS